MHGGANRAVPAPVPVTAGAGVPLYLTKPGNVCLVQKTPENMGSSSHEVRLVQATINEIVTLGRPRRIIGDRAYDSDPLDEALASQGIELIAPHRKNDARRTALAPLQKKSVRISYISADSP